MAIVFEHGAAAGGVRDDRINLARPEDIAVRFRELLRGCCEGGMVMQGATANLGTRDQHLAAVALQDAGGVERGLGEERVAGATGEERYPRTLLALGRQHFGELAVAWF